MTARIFCGEGTECSYSCPAYEIYDDGNCKIVNAILKFQKAKIKAIEEGKGVE